MRRLVIAVATVLMLVTTALSVGAQNEVLVYVSPADKTVSQGETFALSVYCNPTVNTVKGFELGVTFNPDLLEANTVVIGDIFQGHEIFFNDGDIDNVAGTIINIYGLILGAEGQATATGSLIVVSFTTKQTTGTSSIHLTEVGIVSGGEPQYLPVLVTDGTVYTGQTLTISTTGQGSVVPTPDQTVYNYGSSVSLQANPVTGWSFDHWSGDLTGTVNPGLITMNGNKTVTANFKDIELPVITNVLLTSSAVLDTNPSYGWVKVTCTATDNDALDTVKLGILKPGQSTPIMLTMSLVSGVYTLLTYTEFSTPGTNEYFIEAKDISGNTQTTSDYIFLMPPNWEIIYSSSSRTIDMEDLVSVATKFWQTGTNGWIRQDVDNSGKVQVLDLVSVAMHRNQVW